MDRGALASAGRQFVAVGGLMSYGVDVVEQSGKQRPMSTASCAVPCPPTSRCRHRRGITILNLKTAQALGLTVPPGLLVAADEVIA